MATVINETRTFKRTDKAGKVVSNKEYRRIIPTVRETAILQRNGFTPLASSNVSAAAQRGNDLYIRFWNSSIYKYLNQGKNFERLVGAASHGKWVWRFLRKANIPYEKVGSLPLQQDLDQTDEELFEDMTKIKVEDITKVTLRQLDLFNRNAVGLINTFIETGVATNITINLPLILPTFM
jgi:hypothetical protein